MYNVALVSSNLVFKDIARNVSLTELYMYFIKHLYEGIKIAFFIGPN